MGIFGGGGGGGDGEREGGGERENSNTLVLKDGSVRSIWTFLTASPYFTTNTNKHDKMREREIRGGRVKGKEGEREGGRLMENEWRGRERKMERGGGIKKKE